MGWSSFENWLNFASLLWLGGPIVVFMIVAVVAGIGLRSWADRQIAISQGAEGGGLEGYIVSAVLTLLALLMGFTFSLAVDRFETRRALVLEEANAIGTAYLRAQLLEEPHRARMSKLLFDYTDNRVILAKARPDRLQELLAKNDALVLDMWAGASAAFPAIASPGLSAVFLEAMNTVIDLDAARKAARTVRVPTVVYAVLLFYLVVTAGVLGYVFVGDRGRGAAAVMLILLTVSLLLILDIDRPTIGGVREGQGPMEALLASMKAQPPPVFDRYRVEDAKRAGARVP